MEIIIPILESILSEGLKRIFGHLVDKIKRGFNIKNLEKSIIKRLANSFESKSYDFEGYVKKFVSKKLLEEDYKRAIKSRFESQKIKDNIQKLVESIKRDDPVISLFFLTRELNDEFIHNIFGVPGLNPNEKKVVELIGHLIHDEVLKLYKQPEILRFLTISSLFKESSLNDHQITQILYELIDEIRKLDTTARYNEDQYETYKRVWKVLIGVKSAADDLWDNAIHKHLVNFKYNYQKAQRVIEESELFLRSKHIDELKKLLNLFKFYSDGKKLLVAKKDKLAKEIDRAGFRESPEDEQIGTYFKIMASLNLSIEESEDQIEKIISYNRRYREEYLEKLDLILEDFKKLISGSS